MRCERDSFQPQAVQSSVLPSLMVNSPPCCTSHVWAATNARRTGESHPECRYSVVNSQRGNCRVRTLVAFYRAAVSNAKPISVCLRQRARQFRRIPLVTILRVNSWGMMPLLALSAAPVRERFRNVQSSVLPSNSIEPVFKTLWRDVVRRSILYV
jgi:hypothetical protein